MTSIAPLEAVVFDLGNVFVEWSRERLYETLISDAERRRDFLDSVLTVDVNLRLDRGERFDDVLAEVAAAHPSCADLVAAFKTNWTDSLGDVNCDMVSLLDDLRGQVPVYALTNWSGETFPIARARFGWLDWFDGHVVSGEEGTVKPEPEIYRTVSDRFGHAPDGLWFTDDSQVNVDAARVCGWRAELFEGAASVRRQLMALGLRM
ncbi:MAG: HAD family phosphatase [Actinomycetia bacterium]|nr:HAD family phosphatase [Actinomycetes bacterium]MCP4961827.1 HAD family phosphatase [Actinomycetes bacterium]